MRDGLVDQFQEAALPLTEVRSAPKTATKRVFLITDEDDPNAGPGKDRLMTSARTTLIVSDI